MRNLRPPGLTALFTFFYAASGWYLGLPQLRDNSFLWHLRTGHLILDSGVPRSDPYSFTVPGRRWIAQSWLAELSYGVIDELVGPFGIRLLTAALGAATTTLLFRHTLRIVRDRLRAALLMFAALLSIATVVSERPLMFGLLLMACLVWLVEVEGSWAGRHAHLLMPPLLWLWANLHGSFSLGVVYVGLHVAGRWLDGEPPWRGRELRLVSGVAAGLLLSLANPYGPRLLWFPVALVRRGNVLADVVEWMSPDFHTPGRGMYFGLWLTVFVVASTLGRSRIDRRDVVVAVPFALLSLWAVRNVGISTMAMLPVAARAWAGQARADTRSPLGWVTAAALLVLAVVTTTSAVSQRSDIDLRTYPARALSAVEQHGELGRRLLTTDAWAGYTIYRYWPSQTVFMDDRYDMYPQTIMDSYLTVSRVAPGWAEELRRYGIELIVWPREQPLAQILAIDDRWRRVYRDAEAVVYVRADVSADW